MIELTEQHRSLLLDVARNAIRAALAGGPLPVPPASDDTALCQPAGCFVTLHERQTHALRGCIGRMEASSPLLQAVHETAGWVLDDPRFVDRRVRIEDLAALELEISILSPLRPAEHPLAFDPPTDGLYLKIAGRSGCFLPQVARETGWTREQLLSRLCGEKMGLSPEAWRGPEARLFLFSVLILGPEGFETMK